MLQKCFTIISDKNITFVIFFKQCVFYLSKERKIYYEVRDKAPTHIWTFCPDNDKLNRCRLSTEKNNVFLFFLRKVEEIFQFQKKIL